MFVNTMIVFTYCTTTVFIPVSLGLHLHAVLHHLYQILPLINNKREYNQC